MGRMCGQCGGELISETGCSEWCPACDWNVRPKTGNEWRREVAKPSRRRTKLAEDTHQALLKELPSRPNAGLAGLVVIGTACAVLLFQVVLIALAVWIMVASSAKVFSLIFTVPLLVAGVFPFWLVIRSSRGRVRVRRTECPQLWAHVERTASAVGAGKVRRLNFDDRFNVSVHRGVAGSDLTIGLQLWAALPQPHRTAVLAHELAHVRNGDPIRGFAVGVSMVALEEWYQLLRTTRGGFAALFTAALAWPVGAYMSLMRKLAALTNQRAEYFADLCAADAVSTETLVAALATVHSGSVTAATAMQRTPRGGDAWEAIRVRFAELPEGELRRRRRAAELDVDPDPDGTHPPMGYRIAVLRAHPRTGDASLTATPEFADEGFAEVQAAVARHMNQGRRRRRR